MKRAPALAALSRDHHQALAAALRLRRASADDLDESTAAFAGFWEQHGARHLAIEEQVLLPALPDDPDWRTAAERVRREHGALRAAAAQLGDAGTPDRLAVAHRIGELLERHVRFEERELFEMLQARLPEDELEQLGEAIDRAERGGDPGAQRP